MSPVRTGLDRWPTLAPEDLGLAAGARLGLVAHPASIDASGRHAVEVLRSDARYRLERLFAPEHGLRGEAQDMEAVDEREDVSSGLPVSSLYGAHASSLRPRPEHLAGLDAIVCDLQDVGSRYYTFVYTMAYVMEAAADAGIPVVVLDRPNPIGGVRVEGPVLETAWASFVGRYPLPVRHGMTAGELARLFAGVFAAGSPPRVVALEGWRREMEFEHTGLPWVLPSPNMPTPDTARVYPGGCLVEGTNLSEGRGTTRPFELLGAPWLSPNRFAAAVARAAEADSIEGVLFRAASFRPTFQKHAGRSCGGLQVHATDRGRFRPFATYLLLLREARRQDPASFDWRRQAYEFETERLAIDLLLGRTGLREMIEAGASIPAMEASWREGLEAFEGLRRNFLTY